MNSIVIPVRCVSGGTILLDVEPNWVYDPSGEPLGTLTLATATGRGRPVPLELVKFQAVEEVLRNTALWPFGPRRQTRIRLRDLHHAGLSLREPIEVSLEVWEHVVTAYCYDLDEFEIGSDESTAMTELRKAIADLYHILKSDQHRLGPLPQAQWDYLHRIIQEV